MATTKEISQAFNNKIEIEKAKNKSLNPALVLEIKKELDKNHILDDREKITVFLGCLTGYEKNPRDRKSVTLTGYSSVGKDNLKDTIINEFPQEDILKLTRGTTSFIEDDISKFNIIAFSELNTKNDKGANNEIVETLKQIMEGGTSTGKKDIKTGFKTSKHVQQEQKTIIYGSTETEKDEELETRSTIITVKGTPAKTKKVNENTLNSIAELPKEDNKKYNWIRELIRQIKPFYDYPIYAPYLKKIYDYIDNNEIRSMRDVKSLRSYLTAYVRLHAKQNRLQEINGHKVLLSIPQDFYNVVQIVMPFFNQTYKGYDGRLQEIIDYTEKNSPQETDINGNKYYNRKKIQEALNIKSVDTIRSYCTKLHKLGIITHFHDKEKNITWVIIEAEGTKMGTIGLLKDTNNLDLLNILGIKNWNELVHISTLKVPLQVTPKIPLKLDFDSLRHSEVEGTKNLHKGTVKEEKEKITVPHKKISNQKLVPSGFDYNNKCEVCKNIPSILQDKDNFRCVNCLEIKTEDLEE